MAIHVCSQRDLRVRQVGLNDLGVLVGTLVDLAQRASVGASEVVYDVVACAFKTTISEPQDPLIRLDEHS